MERETLNNKLKQKLDINVYVNQAMEDRTIIPILLDIIETDKSAIKFLCEKIIRGVSERNPKLLYPFFERMALLMETENNFIKWGLILTLPNLLKVDEEKKWEKVSKHYLAFLDSASIVTFGNTVSGVRKILEIYPNYEKRIVSKLLIIDQHTFLHKGEESPECLNVAKGQIIDCFDEIYPISNYQKQMRTFAHANVNNSRKQVRNKAKRFLKNTE